MAEASGIARRTFLAGIASVGAGLLMPDAGRAFQLPVSPDRYRIDTHHHVFPPGYVTELVSRKLAAADATGWTVAKTLDDMEKAGVATAILSVTTPAVSFADAAGARRIAREANEWVARLSADHPGRFGSFAMIPMQDVDGRLREIEYALDTLKADGIALLTSYGDKWLGHQTFAPVLDELNRRKAILYTHPTLAN